MSEILGCIVDAPSFRTLHTFTTLTALYLGYGVSFGPREPSHVGGRISVSRGDLNGFRQEVNIFIQPFAAATASQRDLECVGMLDTDLDELSRLHGVTKWTIRDSPNLVGKLQPSDQHAAFASSVSTIVLRQCPGIKPALFRCFLKFTALNVLQLADCPFNDTCAETLARSAALTDLSLYNCSLLTDVGIHELCTRQGLLRRIDLTGCVGVTTMGLKELSANIPGIVIVASSWRCHPSDTDLTQVRNLQHVRSLDLRGCQATLANEIRRVLAPLNSPDAYLTSLNIAGCGNVEGMAAITRWWPKLTSLDVTGCCHIGVGFLGGLEFLKRLYLGRCEFVGSNGRDAKLDDGTVTVTATDVGAFRSDVEFHFTSMMIGNDAASPFYVLRCHGLANSDDIDRLVRLCRDNVASTSDLAVNCKSLRIDLLDCSLSTGCLARLFGLGVTISAADWRCHPDDSDLGPVCRLDNLSTLDIQSCKGLTTENVQKAAQAHAKTLQTFNVAHCTSIDFGVVLNGITRLTCLDVTGCVSIEPFKSLHGLQRLHVGPCVFVGRCFRCTDERVAAGDGLVTITWRNMDEFQSSVAFYVAPLRGSTRRREEAVKVHRLTDEDIPRLVRIRGATTLTIDHSPYFTGSTLHAELQRAAAFTDTVGALHLKNCGSFTWFAALKHFAAVKISRFSRLPEARRQFDRLF